jgi:hypothetical protein
MEPNESHPLKLSLPQLHSLLSSLSPLLRSTPVEFDASEPVSSLISYFFSLYSSLSDSDRLCFEEAQSSMLPADASLEWFLKQQASIDEAVRWAFIPSHDAYRVEGAHKQGGLQLLDPAVTSKIRGVATEVLKQLGRKLLSGNFNLTQISFPIRCMQSSTVLHNTLNTFQMAPLYINRAVGVKDRVERMKLVITSMLGSFVNTSTFEKPLNPILGETQVAEMEDGTRMFAEQISHHPPVSAFFVEGTGYKIHGHFNYTAKAGLNSVTVTNVGKRVFEFYDRHRITVTCPEELFSGTFMGTMRHESLGTIDVSDNQGNFCKISIGKEKGKPSDYLRGVIMNGNNLEMSELQGTYLGFLEFDGVRYWDARYVRPFRVKFLQVLESDSECRKDMRVLRAGNIDEAQNAKEELENLQRFDRKLREKYGGSH